MESITVFSGVPVVPQRPSKHSSKARPPLLTHAWRFLTPKEQAEPVPNRRATHAEVSNAQLEAVVQARLLLRLEAGLSALPGALEASSGSASASQSRKAPKAPGARQTFGAVSHRGADSPGDSDDDDADDETSLDDDDDDSDDVPRFHDSTPHRKSTGQEHRAMGGFRRFGDDDGLQSPKLERTGPPPPIVIWRPPETVRIAKDVPVELTRVENRLASIAKMQVSQLKKGAGAATPAGGRRGHVAPQTPTVAASPRGVAPLKMPTPPGSPSRLAQEARRSRAALEYMRSQRARALQKTTVCVEKRTAPYGAWYIAPEKWDACGRPREDAAAGSRGGSASAPEGVWGAEALELKQREQSLQQEILTAYISKEFKAYVDERGLRVPVALKSLHVDSARRPGYDTATLRLMLPALEPLLKQATARALRREFQAACVPKASTRCPLLAFREILARHGFRFQEAEFDELVHIALMGDEHGASRHACIDYNLFLHRCADALGKLRNKQPRAPAPSSPALPDSDDR
ncbi:hypothetical protein M885DRAFT_610207 [Pelagophyceae sp. CCMP2097]|nr:hypothetical protein M885DRAFT_610207 [Pelagophyceae sp. CCMP2097]